MNHRSDESLEPASGFISRRQFLRNAGMLAGGAMAGSLLLAGACKKSIVTLTSTVITTTTPPTTTVRLPPVNGLEYLVNSNPANVDDSKLPVTPLNLLHVFNPSPAVDIEAYKLTVQGSVSTPLSLSYADLQQFPMKQETALLICPTVFADNETLGGFPLTALLTQAEINPGATQLVFSSLDNLKETILLSDALSQDMFLALTLEGETLPQAHGYPLRLIRPGQIGVFWFKCIGSIQVS